MKIDPKTGWVDAKSALTWPPVQYDHPFKGDLVIIRASIVHVKELCPPIQTGFAPVGCSYVSPVKDANGLPNYCKIIMAHDADIRAVGEDTEEVLRHEQGHCNGWPADHPGARLDPR